MQREIGSIISEIAIIRNNYSDNTNLWSDLSNLMNMCVDLEKSINELKG